MSHLQHADGSWSVVGADGWPMAVDDYLAELRELEADVSVLDGLGLVVIDVDSVSVRDDLRLCRPGGCSAPAAPEPSNPGQL